MGTCRTSSEGEKLLLGSLLDDFVTEKIKESQSFWSGSNQYSSWGRIYFFPERNAKGREKPTKRGICFFWGGAEWEEEAELHLSAWHCAPSPLTGLGHGHSLSHASLVHAHRLRVGAPGTPTSTVQRLKSCRGLPTICSTASFLFPLLWKLFLEATLIFFSSIN